MTVFAVSTIVGTRPDNIDPAMVAMVAPRPLYGQEAVLHPGWGWAGQVLVDPADRFAVDSNRDLDARVVRWVTRDAVIAAERARLAVDYGVEAVDAVTDDDIFDGYHPNPATTEI